MWMFYKETDLKLSYSTALDLQKLLDDHVALGPIHALKNPHEVLLCQGVCTEVANRIADKALQIFGGAGYIKGMVVERFYRVDGQAACSTMLSTLTEKV